MTAIPDSSPAVAPSVIAGLLLAARDHQLRLGLPSAGVEQIVERTTASRSSAYEAKATLLGSLASLVRPVGRPPAVVAAAPPPGASEAVQRVALRFLMDHPGCVHGSAERRQYADCYRRFVLDQVLSHRELGVEQLAQAVQVPLDTLRDWMRTPAEPAADVPSKAEAPADTSGNLHIQTVLAAWKSWEGGFVPFCDHVREHLRVPFGRTAIGAILEAHGVRRRARRAGRSPDESALRGAFETFFPGAQWVADGTPVTVSFGGERFTFNFELTVDAHSGAFTGVSIRDEEDSAAVIEAVQDGKATTGSAPLALLVDNRPSNLTPEVQQALENEQTLLIPATKARPQNKAHVEGAFGLFFQTLPAIVLAAATNREAAREVLRLVVTTWARTLNGRPRSDRGGKSRIDLYADKPTAEQIEQARAALAERLRQQELARQTLQARQDPVVRQTLAAAFSRLALADPLGHLLDAIARYPLSAVVDGISVFEGKRAAGTLPPDVDARYLLGIVRNIANEREGERVAESMLRLRLEARDAVLAPLVEGRRRLDEQTTDVPSRLVCFVDRALGAQRWLDRLFWLGATADLIRAAPAAEHASLYRLGARRINTASRLPYRERLSAIRYLADGAVPLD